MTPTPYALSVRDRVGELVRQARDVLAPSRAFDPADLDRTITLQCHDALTTALAPPLLTAVAKLAPGVRLRFLAEPASDTDDLRHGRIDLVIGATAPDLPEFRSEKVGHDRVVAILRRDHPHGGRLDLAAYAGRPHILVSRRGRLTDPVDDILATYGLSRRVTASVGTAASALLIVSRSDAVLTAPEAVWRPLIETFDLRIEQLPFPGPTPPMICAWHQRYDTDAAHTWLRGHVRQTLVAAVAGLAENPAPLTEQADRLDARAVVCGFTSRLGRCDVATRVAGGPAHGRRGGSHGDIGLRLG